MVEDYKAGERVLALVNAERTFGEVSLETEKAARSFVSQAWGISGGNIAQFPGNVVGLIDADISIAKSKDSTIVGDKILVFLRDPKTAKLGLIAYLITLSCSLAPEKATIRSSGGVPKMESQTDVYSVAKQWVAAYDGGAHTPAAAVKLIVGKIKDLSSLEEIKGEIKAVAEATERHKAAIAAAEAAEEQTDAWGPFNGNLQVQTESIDGVEVAGETSIPYLRKLAASVNALADRTEQSVAAAKKPAAKKAAAAK